MASLLISYMLVFLVEMSSGHQVGQSVVIGGTKYLNSNFHTMVGATQVIQVKGEGYAPFLLGPISLFRMMQVASLNFVKGLCFYSAAQNITHGQKPFILYKTFYTLWYKCHVFTKEYFVPQLAAQLRSPREQMNVRMPLHWREWGLKQVEFSPGNLLVEPLWWVFFQGKERKRVFLQSWL